MWRAPQLAQLAAAGDLAGDQLPEQHAEGEDVGDLIAFAAGEQLGGRVCKGAHAVEAADVRCLHHLRQAHVRDLRLAFPARRTTELSDLKFFFRQHHLRQAHVRDLRLALPARRATELSGLGFQDLIMYVVCTICARPTSAIFALPSLCAAPQNCHF